MALIRFEISLAIPENVYTTIPAPKRAAIISQIRELKALAVKINAGAPNEEATVRAIWHRCHHDESPPLPCELEQEI